MSVGPDGFGTQTAEMHRAGQHVLSVNEAIQGELRALRVRLESLHGLWRGEAATTFRLLMERWDRDATTLAEALVGIGTAIQASGGTYATQEAEQQAAFSSITAALG